MAAHWSTSISRVEPDDVYIRGYRLGELIGRLTFPAATFLLIRARIPTPGEARMMDAILSSVLDYGLKKPGTVAARYCVSANPSMAAGLAAAVLSVGSYALAPEEAGLFISRTLREANTPGTVLGDEAASLVDRLMAAHQRVPGFGHPKFRYIDPRAETLKKIAREAGLWGKACDWYEAVHQALIQKADRPELVINEVGMMAAILIDMGFAPHEMTGIAILSSLPGVIAHVAEEMQSGVRIRAVPDHLIDTSVDTKDLDEGMRRAGWTD
jgi:citryl-CoA lyase